MNLNRCDMVTIMRMIERGSLPLPASHVDPCYDIQRLDASYPSITKYEQNRNSHRKWVSENREKSREYAKKRYHANKSK